MSKFTLLSADFHRNGSGGEGYYVGLFDAPRDRGNLPDDPEKYFITVFPVFDRDGRVDYERHWERVACIRVVDIKGGNLYMFPRGDMPGGAALRSADYYQDAAKAVVRLATEQMEAQFQDDVQAIKAARGRKIGGTL